MLNPLLALLALWAASQGLIASNISASNFVHTGLKKTCCAEMDDNPLPEGADPELLRSMNDIHGEYDTLPSKVKAV